MVAVFVSDALWDAVGERLVAADPGVERIRFVPGERVSEADIARIQVACLSSDLYPRWSGSYLRVCLDAPHLRWLHSFSAGVDHPVFGMIVERGAALTNSTGSSARAIAHHVIMCLLAMRRDLPMVLRDQADRRWNTRDVGDVEGRSVAVVGMGPIGLEVARLTAELGMRPIGIRRTVRGDEPCETWTFDRLAELLVRSDALVLAVPLAPTTRRLIGAAELALLPAGAHVVNVGRGELIDQRALIAALANGQVGWAALDVTEVEPLPDDDELWSMPNVIITPHSSGSTASTRRRASDMFADNFVRFVRNEPLANVVG